MNTPLNLCRCCERDFASLAAFDEHFETPTSRRCLDVVADLEGWFEDERGRWTNARLAKDAQRVRARRQSGALSPGERAGGDGTPELGVGCL